jgi:excisionase family DNA binding protein
MRDDLTVNEAAEALGTSPQTVRALLRKGELPGRKQPWGSRYVWVLSRQGVDEFLAEYGRLDGRRRQRSHPAPIEETVETVRSDLAEAPPVTAPQAPPSSGGVPSLFVTAAESSVQRPFVLRPRGRATVVVVVLGVPLLVSYVVARILPGALWFEELGQTDVFVGVVAARAQLYLLVAGIVVLFVGFNLAIAVRRSEIAGTRAGVLGIAAVALVTGSMFGSAAEGHWQTFLLWRHRQSFGVVDPVHGKDVGFFVFSLPFELMVSGLLLWLVAVAACYVGLVYRARGALGFRPPRASFDAQVHLASLAAVFLLVVAWRFRLQQYTLELGQSSPDDSASFSGAGYVDVHIRLPGLQALTIFAVVLALLCFAAPFVARTGSARRAALFVGLPGALLVVGAILVGTLIPALVQRFVVDPNPLLSEQPFLERSIAASRTGLALDTIDVEQYSPTGGFSASDFSPVSERVANVAIWDPWLVEARMRELVTETPYYSPEEPTLDAARVDGRRQLTVVSAREFDPRPVGGQAQTWANDRLAYTHGLGVIRFSGTDIEADRGPHLLDAGLGVREPRIYFGNLPQVRVAADADEEEPKIFTPTTDAPAAESPWVLVDTRRPEVDIPAADGAPRASYHYDGTGGIELSNWVRRTAFAIALGSKELLLSDDITSESRILLHRDVHERLQTLAPFVQWDADAVPLTADGRIVFVVDGYTTSANYPYAERVDLGEAHVNYARASVRATVDAFSGEVDVYLTDESDPIARAWAEAFPTLFRAEEEMPAELRHRLRYPGDLFDAQATAYERLHTTRPDLFVSNADAWSRPIALSGPIEVAGDVDFDESDEDELRLILQPGYTFSPPPGQTRPRLMLGTYYTPSDGQNLVGSLSGWIDEHGRARLYARNLPREPATLGPAQISRLVFATPRVRNLLGLRNLEIRDLDTSSLDAVLLGRPHLYLLPDGVVQIQSLYEGSRGPGAARLLGVTVFLNGRAGLGPDVDSAIRQALNEPPQVDMLPPSGPVVVGKPTELRFRVENARREVVTITSSDGRQREKLEIATGHGSVRWVPSAAGDTRVRVEVAGLDATRVADSTAFRVLSAPPAIRLIDKPTRAVVGRPVRVSFKVRNGVDAVATISTRSGIVFARRYLIRDGTGVVEWTPRAPGSAVLLLRAGGHQGQVASKRLRITVVRRPETPPPPTVTLLLVPDEVAVGRASDFAFRADDCRVAVARIEGPDDTRAWEFPCPARRASFSWTPTTPGRYLLTTIARGGGTTAQVATRLDAERLR